MRGLLGILFLLFLAWCLGERRRGDYPRQIPWRTVVVGLGLQAALAVLLMRFPPASHALLLLNRAALALQEATDRGTAFVFGYLGGGALPFVETAPGASFILAFKVLPLVLTISALSALLYYWGVLQAVTRAFAWVLRRSMGISGALALGAAVHIYVGMIEAPLLIRPYLARMQRGELFAVMSCGMAGVAGTVMVVYATMLGPIIPDALGNILICSVISTPAALAVAALMVPFRPSEDRAEITVGEEPTGAFDALVKGTRDGVAPLVGIVTVLIVTVAVVALVNMALGQLPGGITLQGIFALGFRPVMWLIGVPWAESAEAAALMKKHLLAAVAAVALISGVASAQTYPPAPPPPPGTTVMPVVPLAPVPGPSTSTTTTTVAPSPSGDHREVTIHKEVDEKGNTVIEKDVHREGIAGSTETHTKIETDPDGGSTTTRSKTTTKQE